MRGASAMTRILGFAWSIVSGDQRVPLDKEPRLDGPSGKSDATEAARQIGIIRPAGSDEVAPVHDTLSGWRSAADDGGVPDGDRGPNYSRRRQAAPSGKAQRTSLSLLYST